MIVLSNGVRIFINNEMEKDIYVGISGFGFENDINEVIGIAHLLEHILIEFDPSKFLANASTARSYMSFWCNSIPGKSNNIDAVKTLISWFFYRGKLKDRFDSDRIINHIKELENEYYFRNEIFHCLDILTYLSNGDLYNGGRITMMNNISKITSMLYNRIHRIIGPNIVIFVKKINSCILELLTSSFGTLDSCPLTIPYNVISTMNGKIVMMPSPFYTVMVNVKMTIDNILTIMALYELYHLIDYETVNDKLYVSISFVNENDYENFLKGITVINFNIDKDINLNFSDDYLMNLYLCFPLIRNDILDYITYINTNLNNILESFNNEINNSIYLGKYISIYPNFSDVIYNKNDRQFHKIAVIDSIYNNNIPISNMNNKDINVKNIVPIKLMKKETKNELFITYSDSDLINYVSLALSVNNKILKNSEGISIQHRFSQDDILSILESDTFVKYTKSKPAPIYQYMILSFFVTGNSIDDIINNREAIIRSCKLFKNKIVFGKRCKYDIQTCSSFVAGIIKGKELDEILTKIMWDLKRKGLIYSLDYTKLDKKIYYIFMFTIYPDNVYTYISKMDCVKSHCLVVSKIGNTEDYSSMKKDIVIKLH
ncbi:metalloprotease [Cotia virus SPAn232]|uniref:Metalloendopeptidase n=3 Tax=Cotia virus TaxID=39444 RepID=H6TA42_9POXV|nr:metalloprotease [Cotia virus SPAn232]ADT91082.1 metalloprotease [Cotia virus SPAn232]AIT70681.1 metalloprotease [Cotia virus]